MSGLFDVANEPVNSPADGAESQDVVPPADASEQADATDASDPLWSVWKEARRLLPSGLSKTFLRGITGGALRHAGAPHLRSDLTHWLAPGLRFCGVGAELIPLPREEDACLHWLQENARRKGGVPLFAYREDATTPNTSQENVKRAGANRGRQTAAWNSDEAEMAALARPPDREIVLQARLVSADVLRKQAVLEDAAGNLSECSVEELQTYFADSLRLQKSGARGRRPEHRLHALRAWTTFACAYPDRVLGMELEDAPLRLEAAQFWHQMAGKDRSLPAARLRDAADLFQNAQDAYDIQAAFRLLYRQTCLEMRLPLLTETALLAPDDVVLSEAERRELIYLARAGTRDLKILALYRLWHERDRPDALATLQQSRFDADAWVRASALLSEP